MKETYYFTHDYNVRTDAKIMKLLTIHGYLGYGIFWALIEDLYNNNNSLPTDLDMLAFNLRAEKTLIESVLMDFGLFCVADGSFSSCSVEKRLGERNTKSVKARESVKYRWSKEKPDTNVIRPDEDRNTIKEKKEKEKKEKESKEDHPLKNSNLFRQPKVPRPEEVSQAFLSAGGTLQMADKFFQKHSAVAWFLNGSPITNFRNLIPGFISTWNENLKRNGNTQSIPGKTLDYDRA